MPIAHAHLDAGATYMHNWAPVPHAHAHLDAGAPCACTLGRQFLVPVHTSAPAPHAPARFAGAFVGMDFTIALKDVFCLGKKGQSMPRHMVASSHKHSAIIIGLDFLTCVGRVPLFPGRRMAQKKKGDARRGRMRMAIEPLRILEAPRKCL